MLDSIEAEVEMVARHFTILREVRANEPIGILKLAEATDIPRHKVRYSLGTLQDRGLIEPSNKGAQTTDQTEGFVTRLDDRLSEISDELDAVWEDEQ